MKRILLLSGAAAAVFLAGCVVTSVCPFYTQKDLTFEPALLGNWINPKNGEEEVWNFQRSADYAYRFTLIEERKATVMEARAFKLQGQLFLDIFSTDQDIHVIPAHYLLRVSSITPALRMSELDDGWLRALIAKEPAAIRHHDLRTGDKPDDKRIVLTADTPELQKFVVAHLNTREAWKECFELKREIPKVKFDALGGTFTAK